MRKSKADLVNNAQRKPRRTRASRFAASMDPTLLDKANQTQGCWYETQEEIEQGLEWGRRKAELLKWVRRQMGRRLTTRERRCVELYFFKGMTYREVGKAMGTNGTVRRSVRKLRNAAKKQPAPAKDGTSNANHPPISG